MLGEMASLWGYEENNDTEQLGQKLLLTTLELEKLKAEAMDEMEKNKEYIKQLIHLLKFATQERDEARNHLHKLLNKTGVSLPISPLLEDNSPLGKHGKANSSITESNSPSDTYNYHSHCSSPVDSLFDDMSSAGFSNINLVPNQPLALDSSAALNTNPINPRVVQEVEKGSLIIDNIVKGRVLPEKGKFLQAVLRAGPLLQTLLVAGPLPRWRNPPQFQPVQIPPVSINGCDAAVLSQKPASYMGHVGSGSLSVQPFAQLSCGTAQVLAAPLLNASNLGSGTCLSNASLSSFGMNCSGYAPSAKRQRLI